MPSLVATGTAGLTPNTAANPMTTTGTVPTMPAHQSGDLLLMFAFFNTGATTTGSITAPAGWSDFGLPFGAAADSFIGAVYYKLAASSAETYTSPSFVNATTGTSGGVGITQVHAYRDVNTSSLPASAKATSSTTGSVVASVNNGPIGALAFDTNNVLVVVGAGRRGVAVDANILTGDGLTWTEVLDVSTTNGGDAAAVINVSSEQTSPATITSKTFTYVTTPASDRWGGFQFALTEELMTDNVTIDNGALTDFVASTDEAASGHIQRMKLCYATDGVDTHVPADVNGLQVQQRPVSSVTDTLTFDEDTVELTIPAAATDFAIMLSGTFTGSTQLQVERTYDNSTWWPAPIVTPTGSSQGLMGTNGNEITQGAFAFGATTFVGSTQLATKIRVRVNVYQASDSITVILRAGLGGSINTPAAIRISGESKQATGASFVPTKDMRDSGRVPLHLWATGVAAGATTVETAITLTKTVQLGAATTTGTSHAPTDGKFWHITNIVFASRGHNTATAQATTFTLRVNASGAVTTSSNAILACRSATPAVANDWDRVNLDLGEGIQVFGTATLQIGLSAVAVYTTNAPTWDAQILGFMY